MNELRKSEERALAYLKEMFPGYAWDKTTGSKLMDFMGVPPPESRLPTLFVGSKVGADTVRYSQNEFAKSEAGMRCRKYVIYGDGNDDGAPLIVYTWDDYLEFIEGENAIDGAARKSAERAANRKPEPCIYIVQQENGGARAAVRIDSYDKCTVLSASIFRGEEQPSMPESTSKMRAKMRASGALVPQPDGTLKLMQDTVFTSLGTAATAILGRPGALDNFDALNKGPDFS